MIDSFSEHKRKRATFIPFNLFTILVSYKHPLQKGTNVRVSGIPFQQNKQFLIFLGRNVVFFSIWKLNYEKLLKNSFGKRPLFTLAYTLCRWLSNFWFSFQPFNLLTSIQFLLGKYFEIKSCCIVNKHDAFKYMHSNSIQISLLDSSANLHFASLYHVSLDLNDFEIKRKNGWKGRRMLNQIITYHKRKNKYMLCICWYTNIPLTLF